MREATKEEKESVINYVESISDDIPIQDNCLDCIHRNVCYKSAWQQEPCKDKIKEDKM